MLSFNKKRLLSAATLEVAARWFLGAVFIYSSYHKILDPGQFARILYGYDLFPLPIIHPIAVICPYFELLCGAALIFGVVPRGAALIVNVMLLIFIAAISINLVRGHEFDCGCFSFSHDVGKSAFHLLIRDLVYLAAGIYVLLYRLSGPDRFAENPA